MHLRHYVCPHTLILTRTAFATDVKAHCVFVVFTPRRYAKRGYATAVLLVCVCLCVSLSVTLVHRVETAEVYYQMISKFS